MKDKNPGPLIKAKIKRRNFDEALKIAEQVIQLNPDDAKVWIQKSIVLEHLNRNDEALEALYKSIKLNPEHTWVGTLTWKGELLCKLERYDEALEVVDKAINLSPDYAEAWIAKGTVLNALKRHDEARKAVGKGIKIKPALVKELKDWRTELIAKLISDDSNEDSIDDDDEKERNPNPTFMKPMNIGEKLAVIVGSKPIPRTEVIKKLWAYINANKLQDIKNKRIINADKNLQSVFGGKKTVSMFDMLELVNKHLR